jgi:hypothetical protein
MMGGMESNDYYMNRGSGNVRYATHICQVQTDVGTMLSTVFMNPAH